MRMRVLALSLLMGFVASFAGVAKSARADGTWEYGPDHEMYAVSGNPDGPWFRNVTDGSKCIRAFGNSETVCNHSDDAIDPGNGAFRVKPLVATGGQQEGSFLVGSYLSGTAYAYKPGVEGAIESLDASFRAIVDPAHPNPSCTSFDLDARLLVEQDNQYYVSGGDLTQTFSLTCSSSPTCSCSASWENFEKTGMVEEDFDLANQSSGIDDSVHPDFSANGENIHFGFAIHCDECGYENSEVQGDYIDDYEVIVNQDTDGDGVADVADNCVDTPNGPIAGFDDQVDTDNDGQGDACDNCIYVPNADQYDSNNDGYGNVCDGDTNNDGFCAANDFGNPIELGGVNACIAAGPTCQPTCLDVDMNGDGFCLASDSGSYFIPCVTTPHPSHPNPPVGPLPPQMLYRSGLDCVNEAIGPTPPGSCPPHN